LYVIGHSQEVTVHHFKILAVALTGLVAACSSQSNSIAYAPESLRSQCRTMGFPNEGIGFERCTHVLSYYNQQCQNRGFDAGGLGITHCKEVGVRYEIERSAQEAGARGRSYPSVAVLTAPGAHMVVQ
jgi:hypothetical protein